MPARIGTSPATPVPEGLSPAEFARLFAMPAKEAAAYLAGRGKLTETYDWRDVYGAEHAHQYTVSRLARLDLLQAVRDAVVRVTDGDLSRRDFMREVQATLEKSGWWGTKQVTDPATGEIVTTRFTPSRLTLIYDMNTRTAHAAGRWERFERNASTHPYLRYITKRDEWVRDSHAAWDGVTLPIGHPFWKTRYPPNGWRCRCRVMSMSQREYDAARGKGWLKTQAPPDKPREWTNPRSGDTRQIPEGVDPGFDYNVGHAAMRARNLEEVVQAKLASSQDLMGGLPRQVLNRVKSELAPSDILATRGLDPDLLADVGAVKAAEYFIGQVRPGILDDIAAGGLSGSAALKHELAEVAALADAGLSIYAPEHIARVRAAFASALKSGDPRKYIPWHLSALRDELRYVQDVLATRGVQVTMGEAARAVYGDLQDEALEKMMIELSELGAAWPGRLKTEVLHALQIPFPARR